MPFIGLQWIFTRTGAAASNHFEGGGFVRSNNEVDYPNLMFHFLPIAVRYDGQKGSGRTWLSSSRRTNVFKLSWQLENQI